MNSTFSHFTTNNYEDDQEDGTKTKKCVLCRSLVKPDDMVCGKCADRVFEDKGVI